MNPQMFEQNLYLILGGVMVLLVGGFLLVATWTGIKIAWWLWQRRRAEKKWKKATLDINGNPYPPTVEGVCDECGRGSRAIYMAPDSDQGRCPFCYEAFITSHRTIEIVPQAFSRGRSH